MTFFTNRSETHLVRPWFALGATANARLTVLLCARRVSALALAKMSLVVPASIHGLASREYASRPAE